MGPALVARSHDQITPGAGSKVLQYAGYASLAGRVEIDAMQKKTSVHATEGSFSATAAPVGVCPHSGAATTGVNSSGVPASHPGNFVGAGVCPFTGATATATATAAAKPVTTVDNHPTPVGGFSYQNFYVTELEKKHKDKSYRYFNNINRLAAKYPVAHTARPTDEVDVWCSNDYLGMGRNPAVLETMQ